MIYQYGTVQSKQTNKKRNNHNTAALLDTEVKIGKRLIKKFTWSWNRRDPDPGLTIQARKVNGWLANVVKSIPARLKITLIGSFCRIGTGSDLYHGVLLNRRFLW